METKTQVHAEDGKQEILITRDFELAVDDLFHAYIDPKIVEHWMGTSVVKLENKPHGSYRFITTDPMGNLHGFNGVIHEFEPNVRITRTFEMENSTFPVQLEYLTFQETSPNKSRLTMHVIYKSVEIRNAILKLPFAHGINQAHNRLQNYFKPR